MEIRPEMVNYPIPDLVGKTGFAVGTGRCGTEFLARVAGHEAGVASCHERNPYNETFHRYARWYRLPVDDEGFLHQKEVEIREDLRDHTFSFESSAFLSVSLRELYDRFGSKFILLVRSPERVVNSFYHKGWYAAPTVRKDPNLAPSYQECESFHHVLARFVPSGDEFLRWNAMTRIGKLAWFWNAMNERILELLNGIPKTHWQVVKIEEMSFARYLQAARFLGWEPTITQEAYEALVERKPNAFSGVRTIDSWTEQESAEFEKEVAPMAEKLGYEHRVDRLPVPVVMPAAVEEKPTFLRRLRDSIAR
jgi:hypothetical protein